jgi:hypothetical protein
MRGLLPAERGAVWGERTMVTFYRPEAHRSSLMLPVHRREATMDQVLIRLLLHLGAGLQVGKPAR